jgi:hypothetical protein
MTITYEDYEPIVQRFNKIYHETKGVGGTAPWDIPLTENEIRLIYISLVASKAKLKEYDPKKGLNQ